jgi:hypothetical protein
LTDANLFRSIKEGDEEFAARLRRAYRENHSKRVVDIINSYLFKEAAERNITGRLADIQENMDGGGKPADDFMKRVSLWASVLGRVYIVCDKKRLPDAEKTGTQRDNINPKAAPYCYMVFPQDILDISFDENNKIRWVLIAERTRDDEDPLASDGEINTFYRLWQVGKWTLFDSNGDAIEEGETGIDVVPVVIVDNEPGTIYNGQSMLNDIAYIDRAIFNNWSRLDVVINDQAFSQLIFPVEAAPADIFEDAEVRKKFLTLATNRVLLYSAQAGTAPSFISPDASQANFILTLIESQVKRLYGMWGMAGETATEVTSQSGVSKAFDFDKLNKLLATKADNLEQAEREIYIIASKWMGNAVDTADVNYPDEFDVKSLSDEIAMAQELALLDIGETFMAEVKKSIAAKALSRPKEETLKQINKEIEAKATEPDESDPNYDFDEDQKGQKDKASKPVVKPIKKAT